MFEQAARLYAYHLQLCRMMTDDLEDALLIQQAAPGTNHPAWILAHLAVGNDYGLMVLGEPIACPKDWRKRFGIGTQPLADRGAYPSKEELLANIHAGQERLTRASANASAETLAKPNPVELMRTTCPTAGDFIAHLMTTHFSFHLGQLSLWRRQMGFKPII